MNNELNIKGLKHGVMIGAIAVIIAMLLFMMGRDAYLGFSGIISMVAVFLIMIYLGRKERDIVSDGYLNYLAAFVYASIVLFISGYMTEFMHITVLNYFDPELKEVLLEQGMEGSEKAFRMIGMDESDIDKGMEDLEVKLKMSFSYFSLLSNSWMFLLRAIFFGSIAALFIRKSKPDFAEE